jgi:hypothetical protein
MGVQNSYSEYAWQNYFLGGWQKYYGTAEHQEIGRDICSVSSRRGTTYVVVGQQRDLNTGTWAAYITKMDDNGNVAWTNTYRGPAGDKDCIAYAVTNAFGGGYVVTGSINNNGSWNVFAVKYKSDGNLEWQKTSVGGSKYRCAYDIKQSPDNYYIMAGVSQDDRMAFLKLRKDGSSPGGIVIYTNTDNKETVSSIGYSVVQIGSEHHLCGQAKMKNSGDYQLMYVKLEITGFILQSKTYGGSYEDCGYEIIENKNMGWPIIAGRYGLSATNSDYWVALVDSSGNLSGDSKHWGHSDNKEELTSIEQSPYGDFIVAGRIDMDGWGQYNVYLAKLNANLGIKPGGEYYYGGSSNAGSLGVKTTGTQTSIGIATVAWPGQYGNGDIYVIRHD